MTKPKNWIAPSSLSPFQTNSPILSRTPSCEHTLGIPNSWYGWGSAISQAESTVRSSIWYGGRNAFVYILLLMMEYARSCGFRARGDQNKRLSTGYGNAHEHTHTFTHIIRINICVSPVLPRRLCKANKHMAHSGSTYSPNVRSNIICSA